ncbi:TonB-dependent receptor, partial [Desulfobulbus rhabdoformis]|uniref:TonB-dependent receptor plug domain-containing protein n=1 Tax=Desulfobulbus rhabdoformis TaxID=34032 RepID=UPI0019641020
GGVGQAAEQSIQAMAGSAFGPLRSTIAVSHAKQDGYDTDISTSQEVDDTELDSVYLRSVLDLPGEHTVSFGGEWSRFERDGLRYYMKKNRIRQGDDNRVGGYLQYDTGDIGSFSATARVYGNHSEGSWDFSPYANADSNERDLVQAEIRTFYQFTPELLVTTGVEGREEKLEGAQMNSGYEGGASEKSGALFSQLSWNPSEQFNITGSLRYDDYDSAGNHLTPRLIATFYQQNFKVWASYGKGFRAATLDELYGSTTKKQGKYLYVGNDNLDPEISDSFEIGLEGHTDTIRSSLVFFYNDLEDLIEAHETGSSGGITTFTYANIESAETYGLEFAGGIDLTKNLHFSGHITWLQTENKETGYDLATEPEWKGQLKVTWLIPRLSLETQLRYFYFGDCEDGLGAAIDGYDGVGLHIEKKFGKNYAVYVGVENLFDEENDYFLQDPVQAYIGLRYTL